MPRPRFLELPTKVPSFPCPTNSCIKCHVQLSSCNAHSFCLSADTRGHLRRPQWSRGTEPLLWEAVFCSHATVHRLLTASLAICVEIPPSPLIEQQRALPLPASFYIAISWRTSSLSTLLREWPPPDIPHGLHSKPRRMSFQRTDRD